MYEGAGGDRLQRKQLVKRLQSYFGEDSVILSSSGLANVLVFKSRAPNVIGLVKDKDDASVDTALSIVAKKIVKEVKLLEIDKSKYETRLTEKALTEPISDTLMLLLGQLSTKLNNHNPAYMIGYMVTGCVRNFPTTLQIALGVLV